ncbi:hypothetical protein MT349_02530 [Rathayibacter caricis]|uniref:hypothetical protein n=1 Tax=Rathayibacter caricis TaxID=110936 RepID=UPI001FB39DEA|nr:hypothetical protein [Rathayibacter caricis]MCJ1694646.1 hypothetical protein [Rathayibacter caricis]
MIEWGSVADWFAAVGTVAAFGLGLLILWRDRMKEERKFADQFMTWFGTTGIVAKPDANGKRPSTVVVQVHNTGHVTIPIALLDSIHRTEPHMLYQLGEGDESHVVEPGMKHLRQFKFADTINRNEFFVFIKDGTGKVWLRQIETGRYISQAGLKRLQKNPESRRAKRWLKK